MYSAPVRLHPCNAQEVLRLISTNYKSRALLGSVYSNEKAIFYLRHLLGDSSNVFWGILKGEQLACFAHIKRLDQLNHLNHIITDLPYRGLGLGSALMKHILDYPICRNKCISLDVESRNYSALSWYKSLCFVHVDTVKKQLLASRGGDDQPLSRVTLDNYDNWLNYGFGYGQLHVACFDLTIPVGVVYPNTFNIESSLLIDGVADGILSQSKGCRVIAHGPHGLEDSKYFKIGWKILRMVRDPLKSP